MKMYGVVPLTKIVNWAERRVRDAKYVIKLYRV